MSSVCHSHNLLAGVTPKIAYCPSKYRRCDECFAIIHDNITPVIRQGHHRLDTKGLPKDGVARLLNYSNSMIWAYINVELQTTQWEYPKELEMGLKMLH